MAFFYIWINDINMTTMRKNDVKADNLTQAQALILLVDFVHTNGKLNIISIDL
jgi:hypothetical protein